MKAILLIVNDIHFKGGGEKVASHIASWYAQKGVNCCILSMDKRKDTEIFPVAASVEIDYLNVKNTFVLSKLLVCIKLYKYLSTHNFDFILGIGTYANVVLGILPKTYGKRVGCEHNSFDCVSFIWKMLRKISYNKLDATIVLTNEDLFKMKQLNTCSFVIPNSIFLPEQKSSLNNKTILAIGKLYPQKGFDIMLHVFSSFAKINRDWNLVIVGDGQDKKNLLRMIEVLDLEDRIKIMPPTNNVSKYYLSSSIYLMTSRFEGLPMVLLEAQSYGLPIISFDCKTGPKEVVSDNYNGYLLPEGEMDRMVDCMLKLCGDDKLRHLMGERAAKDASRFSPEKVYMLWDKLFTLLS